MTKVLRIFDTLQKKKVDFVPNNAKHIKVYACGPTVYNYAHIGNARMAVSCDLLVKVLRTIYPKVTYVSNITDVDDKIIEESKKSNTSIKNLTEKFSSIYNEDMSYLNVEKPDIQPKATDYIDHMIKFIINLIENKVAYVRDGHVLFHVPSYKFYGILSKRTIDEQIAGSRVEIAPYKKYPGDFVLWKPSKDNEPGWNSPWGFGRPGWHLECSAMSKECLGFPFDIHAGGIDLTFPHHENEIAQSCSLNCNHEPQSFCKYWFHNGFVMSDGEKMSKSLGNIKLVHDLKNSFSGSVLRLALLKSHYRQPLNWTKKLLEESEKNLQKIQNIFGQSEMKNFKKYDSNEIPNEIWDALYDDLNTPKVFAYLLSMVKNVTESKKSEDLKKKIISTVSLLGIYPLSKDKKSLDISFIENLIKKRNNARSNKEYELADKIRKEIESMGVTIEDKKNETTWIQK